jgi:hypothetical protein
MDKQGIRAVLEQCYQENRALIAGLSEADMERPTPNPKWNVRTLAAHIAEDPAGAVYVGKLLAQGKNAKAPDLVVNVFNWWGLRKYKRAGAADLVAVLDRRQQELLTWLDSAPEQALQNGGQVSQVGTVTLGEFLTRNGEHSREHAADIRSALASGAATSTQPAG